MGTGSPDLTYTITVDAFLVIAVTLCHVVLLFGLIMLAPRKVKESLPGADDPEPDRAPEPPTLPYGVTGRSPDVYHARRSGDCFHAARDCPKLKCAKTVDQLGP